MERLAANKGIFYLRYMEDVAILAKTHWHLKRAIREVFRVALSLGLQLHRKKRFIGRIDNGLVKSYFSNLRDRAHTAIKKSFLNQFSVS